MKAALSEMVIEGIVTPYRFTGALADEGFRRADFILNILKKSSWLKEIVKDDFRVVR